MMKFTKLSLGISSLLALIGAAMYLPQPASAQCVQADVSTQYTIDGSTTPTDRQNDTTFESDPSCKGNASVTTGEQGSVGGNNQTIQKREVYHEQNSSSSNSSDLNRPTVQSDPNVGADIYNPADNY